MLQLPGTVEQESVAQVKPQRIDRMILEIALRKMSLAFDEFIGAALKDGGPTKQDVAKARGFLPPYCGHAYKKR